MLSSNLSPEDWLASPAKTPSDPGSTASDTARQPSAPARPGGNVESFVESYLPVAQRVSEKTGIAPEALLGQWGLETGWGKSVIPGTNNLGNIKDFSGRGPVAVDNMTKSKDSYMSFGSPDEFADHYAGLLSRRYKTALNSSSPESFFTELKRGGYAEDPLYVQKGMAATGMVTKAIGGKNGVATSENPTQQEYYTPQSSSMVSYEPDNRTFFEKVAGGFEKGAHQSAGLGASALALLNRTVTGEEGNDFQKSMLGFAKDQEQAASKASGGAPQFTDVVSGDGSFSDWLADSIGYLGYQVGEAVLTGGAGALLGRTVGKEVVQQVATNAIAREAAKIAATDAGKALTKEQIGEMAAKRVAGELTGGATLFANNLRQEGGSIYSDALDHRKEDGAPIDLGNVWLASLAAAGLDTVADAAAARGILGREGSSAGNYLSRAATQVPRQMAIQGGTEFGQNLIEAAGAGRDPFTKQQLISGLNDAAVGALGGFPAGLGSAVRRVPDGLKPLADKAAQGNAPLSSAALAGAQSQPAQPEAPTVDPVKRLAELEAIGRGTEDQVITGPDGNELTIPGEPGRFFTPEEKSEYDQLVALRDATPGMTPEERKAADDQKAAEQPKEDPLLNRARGIEQMLRTNDGLAALRSEESPVTVNAFLSDLARAKSKSTPAAAREQALARLESTAEWLGFDLSALPSSEAVENAPASADADATETQSASGRPLSPEAQAWMATREPGQQTVPTRDQVRNREATEVVSRTELPPNDRRAAIEALNTHRNTNLPQRTRQEALSMALEIVGRNTAPVSSTPAQEGRTPAVLGEIKPQPDTPAYFESEAQRREEGAWQFRQLGFDDEANALLAEADSLREQAASARAGELGLEDNPDADVASPVQAQTVDEATRGLARAPIPVATDTDTGEAGTALRRKRKSQFQQLAGIGFDTVERRDGGFVFVNTKTKQEVTLESPADAQMARVAVKERVDALANTAAASPKNDRLEPTAAQIEAGNYKKSDVIDLNGVKIKIENPAGSVRRGVSPDGKPWETTMVHHYGEIAGTEGADGDKVDVFIGNRPDSNRVWVVDQVNPDGTFDEHKLVFGATSEEDARQTYLANYEKGWTGLGSITEIPVSQLRPWLRSQAKRPAAETLVSPIAVRVNGVDKTIMPVMADALPASDAESRARGGKRQVITKRQAVILKGIAGIFGKDVVFFDDSSAPINSDGFIRPEDTSTVYLNIRSGISPLAVLGHELLHVQRRESPAAYAAVAKVVQSRVKDSRGFRSYYNRTALDKTPDGELNDAELEELISDLNGNLMSDPTFWKEVFDEIQAANGDKAKGIIAQLAAFVQKVIDAAAKAFSGQSKFKSDQYVNDMAAIREAFRKGLAQYAQSQGITKAAMQAEILRAGKGQGEITRSSSRPDDGLTVEAYHFSKQPRTILSTGLYGSGLQGLERDSVMASDDKRLRDRLYFYVNKGTGVRPESGVGGIAHKATLTNIYDADADMRRLRQGRDLRGFESAVLNAGYSGYMSRMMGTQPGQVVLLGSQTVQPEILGLRSQIDDAKAVPAAAQRPMDLGDKIAANNALPAGRMSGEQWAKIMMAVMPEEAAKLMEVGAFDGEMMYRSELASKARSLLSDIRQSTSRAKDEYAEVEAKLKGTDQWMKAPNGDATDLTERQWVQVRTPSFKKWFGDWESAYKAGGVWAAKPGTVSTVVGENGEPLVVYHGTDNGGFAEFKQPDGQMRGDLGIFTTSSEAMASTYVHRNLVRRIDGIGDDSRPGHQRGIYALFLNLRNPNESHFEGANWDGKRYNQFQVLDENDDPIYDNDGNQYLYDFEAESLADDNKGSRIVPAEDHYETTDGVVREAWRYKNDGAIIRSVVDDGGGGGIEYIGEPSDIFVALSPNQVKSADFNGGEFNDSTSDIRRSQQRNDFDDPNKRTEVSTTVPTAKSKGKVVNDAVNEKWIIDTADVMASKDHQKAAIAAIRSYNAAKVGNNKQAIQDLHDIVVDNLVWLYNKMPANIRERAKLWYDGANRIALGLAERHRIDPRQAAGVLAVLSPQKDWFMNVSLGERLIKIFKDHGNEPWSPAMTAWVRSYVNASMNVETKAARQKLLDDAIRLEGKTLEEMSDRDAARFIRVFDETYHPRSYRIVTPEGGFGDYVTPGDALPEEVDLDADPAEPGSVAWGSYPTIVKGVSILRNGQEENLFRNLSDALGGEHKVRNFYNNIIAPNSADGHVTIDTHAIAAAFIKALSGASVEVMHNFGTTPKGLPGAGGNAATGASGLYGIFADAYRTAAAKSGILAREMQSITWEAIRSIFQPKFKTKRASEVEEIFNRYRDGEITREQARDEAYKIAGGIKTLPWEGTPEGRFVSEGGTSFDGDIAKNPEERATRTLSPADAKDQILINLSAATSSIPGLAELAKAANKGDVLAHQLLQDIAIDNLTHLLAGTSASIKADRVTGLYFNEVEPSVGLSVTFTDEDEQAVLAALAKFGENFNQQAIHVRRKLPMKVAPLTPFADGSFATPVYTWNLKKTLTRKQIQRIIDQSGLAGLSFTDGTVEAYFVGDPNDEIDTIEQQLERFQQQIEVAAKSLSRVGGEVSRGRSRLWSYGQGFGTRIGYDTIRGDVPVGQPLSSKTARRVAEYLNATTGKDGNPAPGRVKTFSQAEAVTEQQADLQREIAEVFDSLPDNDLKNPRVRKAYAELAREAMRQYKALPIKVEVMAGQGEPYKNSDAMRKDVLDNNHLYIYGTTPETFGPPGSDFSLHPLLADSGLKDQNGYPLLFNDLLRAVHDYYAHTMEPTQFGPRGEEAAWKNHMSMTGNPWARWALTTETRGQNSWVNFRPDLDRETPVKDRPFATQKAVLLPAEYALTGNRDVDRLMREFINSLPADQRSGTKPVIKRSPVRNDDDNVTLSYGDEDVASQVAPELDAVEPSKAKGRKVSYEVEVEDSGDTARMTVDAGEALDDYDKRIETMNKLLECLRK